MTNKVSQMELEKIMQSDGIKRYRNRLKGVKGRLETAAPAGRRLLSSTIDIMHKAIKAWEARELKATEKYKGKPRVRADLLPLMQNLDKYIGYRLVAALACRSILDSISVNKKAGRCAMALGAVIENEYILARIEIDDPHWLAYYRNSLGTEGRCTEKGTLIYRHKRLKEYLSASALRREWAGLSAPERMKIGTLLIEIFSTSTGLTTVETRSDFRGKKYAMVCPTPQTLEKLNDWHTYAEILKPIYKPCIIKPKDWTTPIDGGYFSAELFQSPLVKTSDRAYLEELKQLDMGPVYDAVNQMQATEWCLNNDLFSILEEFWQTGVDGAGLPSRVDEVLPSKPSDIETNKDSRDEWRRAARDIHDINQKNRAQRLGFLQTLCLAKDYQQYDKFYYVWQLDWRGRAYPISYFYMQPQGPDFGKALILFNKGKKLDSDAAINCFKIHGSNCFGNDKESIKDRIKWTNDNETLIINCAADPFYYRDWMDADSPWCFLAFCLEYVQWKEDPNFLSRLPVSIDATQSGLQILSLLVLDEEGALGTNLVSTTKPNDLYKSVSDRTTELLEEVKKTTDKQIKDSIKKLNDSYIKRSKKDKFNEKAEKKKLDSAITMANITVQQAEIWLNLGIDRSMVKRPVMTRVYNASQHSMVSYLKDVALEKGLDIPKRYIFRACSFLSKYVKIAIKEKLIGAEGLMAYLGDVANATKGAEVALRWTLPTGFQVKQIYKKKESISVKTHIDGSIRARCYSVDGDLINSRKQRQAFSPNLVHSIDAALMMLVINKLPKDTSFAMVHDSYGVHASDVGALFTAIKEVYHEEFSKPMLANLIEDIKANVPDEYKDKIPEIPAMGSLDIDGILKSTYMYS